VPGDMLQYFVRDGGIQVKKKLKSTGPYRGADKSLAQPTSPCILFDGENILFDASLVMYI
jgi:hypothetical protein